MKNTLLVLIGVLLMSCNQEEKETKQTEINSATIVESTQNFDWLLGSWKRLNEEEGKETFENWEKINDIEYVGVGFTMQKGDTISQEKIKLIKVNQNWDLVVSLGATSDSVRFKGFSHAKHEFSCENIDNDFPNIIKYWKNGDHIHAMISGGEMKITFEFERLK